MLTSADDSSPPQERAPGWQGAGLGQRESDVAHAVRSAAKLGASLLGTWAVALVVRILLPRHLGPAGFGAFQFADAFASTVLAVMTLGLETYTRKEIATRVEHASDYFGGTLVVRLVVAAVALTIALASLAAAGRPDSTLKLVFTVGLAYVLINISATFSALLQSAGVVGWLAVLNVGAKIGWGVGILIAFAFGGGPQSVAVAMLVTESARLAFLTVLARRAVGLRHRIDVRATGAVLLAALPFFVGHAAQMVYTRIDVSVMAFLTNDVEVGWYGGAQSVAGLSLLLSPLIGWVLLPLSSRAAARSEEELTHLFRRAMELTLAMAFPITMLFAVGADVIIATAFGPKYQPAAASLRLLAPTFVLTYITIIEASVLIRLDRSWALTWISISGMVLNPLLNLWMIPHGLALFGPGGAGRAASVAQVITEGYAVLVMTWLLGGRVFDRRGIVMLLKTCAVCLVVVAAHVLLARLGAWRLLVDGALYVALAVVSGAVDVRGWANVVSGAMRRRGGTVGPAPEIA